MKPLGDPVITATINIYRAVSRELLPTPSKSHYLFNTRDLAKIVQGMMQVSCAPWRAAGAVAQQGRVVRWLTLSAVAVVLMVCEIVWLSKAASVVGLDRGHQDTSPNHARKGKGI